MVLQSACSGNRVSRGGRTIKKKNEYTLSSRHAIGVFTKNVRDPPKLIICKVFVSE